MRTVWAFAKREYTHYFVSPMAYAVAILFLVILGLIFVFGVINSPTPDATTINGPMVTLMLFFVPVLTMRLLADEQRSGTLELLLTNPIREWELVVGKWLGAWLFGLTLLAFTAIYPLILVAYGNPDVGPIYSSFLGLALVIGALMAIGLFASTVTSNLVVSVAVGYTFVLFIWIISIVSSLLSALAAFANPSILAVVDFLDFSSHFQNTFGRGIIETSDIAYFVSIIAVFLFLATRIVQSRRWR